jgi:hypothetical protein
MLTTMSLYEIDETGQQFLLQLYQQTNGDPSVQASMYDLGEELGLDRDASSRVAEQLIALQLVEIVTLAGGIAISADGLKEIQASFGDQAIAGEKVTRLGSEPVLNQARSQTVVKVMDELKARAGNLGLDFDKLAELMADLKTIDAQMASPSPKTAIVKECLRSLTSLSGIPGAEDCLSKIRGLLGE